MPPTTVVASAFNNQIINLVRLPKNVTGPAKIGHVGSQNLTTFQNFVTHNFLLQYDMATQFSEIVHNLTGFPTHLTEIKYYISVLRYVSSNHTVYFSPHALFTQAQSQIDMGSNGKQGMN